MSGHFYTLTKVGQHVSRLLGQSSLNLETVQMEGRHCHPSYFHKVKLILIPRKGHFEIYSFCKNAKYDVVRVPIRHTAQEAGQDFQIFLLCSLMFLTLVLVLEHSSWLSITIK